MFPHGVIYKSGSTKEHAEVFLAPKKSVRFLYHFLRVSAAGVAAFAITALIFCFYPIAEKEISFDLHKSAESGFSGLITAPSAESLGLSSYFSIYIPKIDAKADIIPDVNPGNSAIYDAALKKGVAQASGTAFPGEGHLIYLFSHSTDSPIDIARYNAVFYLVRKLTKGDRIIIYFMGKEYDYVVEEELVTSASDTSWLKDSGSGEYLVLQTCDPPGTSWNRLIVVAKPLGTVLKTVPAEEIDN